MKIDLSELKKRIAGLSDKKLIEMLETKSDEYTEEALSIAKEEAQRRGGISIIEKKYQDKFAKRKNREEQRKNRIKEVKKHYGYLNHVEATWRHWLKVYGLIVIAWSIYRIFETRPEIDSIGKVISSGFFWVGIVFLILLSVIYALIAARFTYRDTIEDMIALKCPKCEKKSIMRMSIIRMKADEYMQSNNPCEFCKAPIKVDCKASIDFYKDKGEVEDEDIHEKEVLAMDELAPQENVLSSMEVKLYKGTFNREAWRIDLTPKEAIFYNPERLKERIVIQKKDIHKYITFREYNAINIILGIGKLRLKFEILDLSDFYSWLPKKE